MDKIVQTGGAKGKGLEYSNVYPITRKTFNKITERIKLRYWLPRKKKNKEDKAILLN
jgi:hypothetical protein